MDILKFNISNDGIIKDNKKFEILFWKVIRNIVIWKLLINYLKEVNEKRGRFFNSIYFGENGLFPSKDTLYETISFYDKFNEQILPGFIAESCTSIKFGSDFNKPLLIGSIPIYTKFIEFGKKFNQPLTSSNSNNNNNNDFTNFCFRYLPSSTISLTLGSGFNQRITKEMFPPSLKYLKLKNEKRLHKGFIQYSPPTLALSNYSIDPHSIPSTVTSLILHNFNQPLLINKNIFPQSLKSLEFIFCMFNHPIPNNFFPSNIEKLVFNQVFNQPLSNENLPKSLRYLELGRNYSQKIDRFPETLNCIKIHNRLKILSYSHWEIEPYPQEFYTVIYKRKKPK